MSRIDNTALITWTNTIEVENEINNRFFNNPNINIEDIVIFAKISPYSYYPIETTITDEGKIRIKNSEDYIGLKLFVGSRCQFLHKRFSINDDSYRIELDEYFKTAWNPKKFIVFQDGYLMNSNLFTFVIPSFENNYYKKYIYSTTKFKKKHGIDVYYIESNDNFSSLPASRDLYLGAIRYIARKNNEKIVPIPYPYKDKKSSFFIFDERGHYLDKGTDYVVSYDELYITLRKPLKLATVDYIIFAFPHIAKEKENVETTDVFGPLSGSPYFKYSYSVQADYNTTGLVRFSPIYDDYVLTKKNFLLFGNGEWIHPNRFEVHSNDAVLFNNREDQEICANISYTMVIFEDNTDHSQFSLPRDFFIVNMKSKEPDQRIFKVESNIPFKYKSFVIFKDGQIITEYKFDEDSEKIYFKNPINGGFYLICFSTQVNNTNQEILVYTTQFDCYHNGEAGTVIPENYVLNNLNNSWVLVFLDGKLLNPSQYKIRDGKVYLNTSLYTKNGKKISLEGSVISLLLLISGFKKDPIKRTEQQIQKIQEWQEDLDYNLQETSYFYIRPSARPTARGIIPLLDTFNGYKLNKRNMLLFNSGGVWIDPQRFDLVDNDRLYLLSPYNHERSLHTSTYYAVTMNDKLTDEKYSPPNVLVIHVKATKDYQNLFEIPKVHRRFRSFILFKGSILLNREYNYVIEDETHVKLTNTLDYMRKGRSLTFVFLDAYSRFGQENIFIQSSFECKLNQATPLPKNFLHKRFNTDHMILFLNGLFISPDKYRILNNSILLDGFIDLESISTRIFTILYMTNMPIGLKYYDYFIPPYSDIPIKERDLVPAAYFTHLLSTHNTGRIVEFENTFSAYELNKSNMLLFANRKFAHPDNYQLYSNNKIIWKIDSSKSSPLDMVIFDDTLVRTDNINVPPSVKTIDIDINGNIVDVPQLGEQYKSFIVFDKSTGKLIDIEIDNKYDMNTEQITFGKDISTTLTFVFLRSYMTFYQQLFFYQYTFLFDKDFKIPLNMFTIDTIKKYLLVFNDGEYLYSNEYDITDGYFRPTDSMVYNSFRFDNLDSVEIVNKNASGKISFSPTFSRYTLKKNNCLLFGNGTWINPSRYNVSSNSITFIDDIDKEHSDYVNYTLVIPTDNEEVTLNIKTFTATTDRQKYFTIPKLNQYDTYLVFKGGILVPNDRIHIEDTTFFFKSNLEYLNAGRSFSLITLDTTKSRWVYPSFKQISFTDNDTNPENGIDIPESWYKYENNLLLFIGGLYINPEVYRIENHKIYLNDIDMYEISKTYTFVTIEQNKKRTIVSLVYLLSLVPDTEDHYDQYVLTRNNGGTTDNFLFSYSYSNPVLNPTNNGQVTFSPSFTEYSLSKNNFLLFGNGSWIHPDRFNLSSNIKLTFNNLPDKQHSDYVNYTMVIPNEGSTSIEPYYPITLNLYQLTATKDNQRIFDLPELTPYSTFLVFIGGLLVPNNERIKIENNQLMFTNADDGLMKGRSLDLVVLDDSNIKDRRYPVFVQDTFVANSDPTKGTTIPSDWQAYENKMLVFFAGRYIDPELYRIENHQIFLDTDFANLAMLKSHNIKRKYTLVYMASNVIDEYWEKIKPQIDVEPTPKRIIPKDDPLDFTGYYFDIYESEYDVNGYITYDPGFTPYSLTKADFLLFGNSTFIHPSRYTFINNKSLRMIDSIDRKHAPFALYNMVIPFSKDAKDYYKEDYIKPKFQIVEIVTTERTNELEFPVLDAEYESVLMFRNSLILPIYDEDRFVIDDINHKFMIVNEADWIPANTTVTFIFMSSKTNTDAKILLVQDSFKCVDYFTQIPNSIYRYPGQKFNKAKMLLYLNGTFVVPERYVMHNNTIFLVDNDIDLNDDHTFTIVYLDEVQSTEYDMEENLIDRTYEDILDDIIFETEVVKPI